MFKNVLCCVVFSKIIRIFVAKTACNKRKVPLLYGTHNDAIDIWNASERNQLFQWLKGLGFDL